MKLYGKETWVRIEENTDGTQFVVPWLEAPSKLFQSYVTFESLGLSSTITHLDLLHESLFSLHSPNETFNDVQGIEGRKFDEH